MRSENAHMPRRARLVGRALERMSRVRDMSTHIKYVMCARTRVCCGERRVMGVCVSCACVNKKAAHRHNEARTCEYAAK